MGSFLPLSLTKTPPASLICLIARSIPSFWYCPGLPSFPVIGRTTPMVMVSPPCAQAWIVNTLLASKATTVKRPTFLRNKDVRFTLPSCDDSLRTEQIELVLTQAARQV